MRNSSGLVSFQPSSVINVETYGFVPRLISEYPHSLQFHFPSQEKFQCILNRIKGTLDAELIFCCCPCRGEIADSVVMEGRGFGFVTFAKGEEAHSFLSHEPGHTIDGKKVLH